MISKSLENEMIFINIELTLIIPARSHDIHCKNEFNRILANLRRLSQVLTINRFSSISQLNVQLSQNATMEQYSYVTSYKCDRCILVMTTQRPVDRSFRCISCHGPVTVQGVRITYVRITLLHYSRKIIVLYCNCFFYR